MKPDRTSAHYYRVPETADFERLAERVRERRHELGLTQAALAAKAGATDRLIRSIELGEERSRHPATLRSIAAALDWSPDSIERILAGEGPEAVKPLTPDQEERLMTLERELADLREHLGLPPRKRPNGGPQSETA